MAPTLDRLAQLTSAFAARLQTATLEEFAVYMEARTELFLALRREVLAEEQGAAVQGREQLAQLLECDKQIVDRMEQLKAEAEQELGKISGGRLAKATYEEDFTEDNSRFFDTRK